MSVPSRRGSGPGPPVADRSAASRPIPAQVRRVAASEPEVDETKRNVLKLAVVAGVLGVGVGASVEGALQYAQPAVEGLSSYPMVRLLDTDGTALTVQKVLDEYDGNTAELLLFNYPLTNEPNFLLNLAPDATNVAGGIGPQNSIVAFSAICQHLGCPAPSLSYYPPNNPCPQTFGGLRFYLHCQCHGSTYDVTRGAAVLTGPAAQPLPQVLLITDEPSGSPPQYPSGNLYAVGVAGPPVNGHASTLQGGYGVGSLSPLASEDPSVPLACNFPS